MYRGLIWLAFLDLRRAWLRSSMTALAIALALIAVTFFAGQIGLRKAELLTGYAESGAAATFGEYSGLEALVRPRLARINELRTKPG